MRRGLPLFLSVILFVVLLESSISIKNVSASTGGSWLSGWSYRKSHVINSASGAGTNYQTKLTVHYGSGSDSGGDVYLNSLCKTNFGDVRFTDGDGVTPIYYWLQNYVSSSQATFWVKIPDNLNSTNATIYIYYGNSAATTTSDGVNTFPLFFDGFETDLSKWAGSQGTATISTDRAFEGTHSLKISSGVNNIYTSRVAWSGVSVHVFYYDLMAGGTKSALINAGDDGYYQTAVGVDTDFSTANYVYRIGFTYYVSNVPRTVGWHEFIIRCHSSAKQILIDGVVQSNTVSENSIPYILLGSAWASNNAVTYFDCFFVTKYVSPEPSQGAWGETNNVADTPSDDWPMFHHDLYHTGYSTSTAPNTNSTLWTYTTGGSIYSSPVLAYGKLYVGSFDYKIYCLNATTGAKIWEYATGNTVWSSPAVADGKVYVGSHDSRVYCLNASTGVKIWSYTTGNLVPSSPAVSDGRVYVGSYDNKVYAFGSAEAPTTYSLNLRIRDWAGNILLSCNVTVAGVGSATSNTYGWANFTNIPLGTYIITVQWQGTTINQTSITLATSDMVMNLKGKVYSLALNFKDNSGSITVTPSQVVVQAPNGTLHILTAYSIPRAQNGTWTIKQIRWRGNNIVTTPNPTKTLASSETWSINTRVYNIDFSNSFLDQQGNKLSPDSDSFQLTCPNGTTVQPLQVRSYFLQNGTFTVVSIIHQGKDVTPTPMPTFDPAMGNPQIMTTFTLAGPSPPFYIVFLTQYAPPTALVVAISLAIVMLYRRRKTGARPMSMPPETKPSKPPGVATQVEQKTIEVAGGYEPIGEFLKVGIKIVNHGGVVATDVSAMLEVPEALTFSEPAVPYLRLGNIRPGEFQSAIYKLKPTRCVDGSVRGVINYYDHLGNRQDVDIPPIHIRNICPFLTSDGVVVADWMDMLKTGLLDSSSSSFEFKGSPRMAFATAENRVRNLTLVEREEKTIDGGYCGYACYFGNAKYGGYYFATTIIVSGTERGGRITLTVYSNDPTVITGYVQEVMEDVRKHIETTQGVTVLTGKCPECGGEFDPTKADEKGLIHCHHCRCLNVIPPWMRIK